MTDGESLRPDEADRVDDLSEEDSGEELKARDLGRIVGFLKTHLAAYRRSIVGLGVLLAMQTAFNISFPLASRYLIDEGLIKHNGDALVFVLSLFAAAAVAGAIIAIVLDYVGAKMFSAVVCDLRVKLFDHLQELPLSFFQTHQTGGVLSRFSGDIVAIEGMLIQLIAWLVLPAAEVLYATGLMFYFNIWLALIGATIFPLVLLGPRYFGVKSFAFSYEKRGHEADLLAAAQENVSAQPVIKAFGLKSWAVADFRRRNDGWLRNAFRMNFFAALVESSASLEVYVVHIVIFSLGAYWAYQGTISVGTLVAFEGMFVSMGYALTGVMQFVPVLAQAAGSIHHIDDIFAEKAGEQEAADAVAIPRFETCLMFEGVTFAYPGAPRPALVGVDLCVDCGTYAAIVGRSGSGKSTIINLLLRFHDPTRGEVTIDGVDLRTVTLSSLRRQIGVVFQDSFLFNASIADNIRLGKADASQFEIESALRTAEVWDFVAQLPDGAETKVGERGGRLSGGQRQRIAIARALVRDPSILILDEATSALDAMAEAALITTLQRIARTRTVISVTHRLGTVVDADIIVVLDQGAIVERGSHPALLKRNGAYAALWRTQHETRRLSAVD